MSEVIEGSLRVSEHCSPRSDRGARRTLSFCETEMMLASGSLRRKPFACSVMYCPAAFSQRLRRKTQRERLHLR